MKIIAILLILIGTMKEPFKVSEFNLKNGLKVVIAEKKELPIFQLLLSIRAGACYDPEGKEGLSNLTAKLLNKGTEKRTASEIAREIESLGARMSFSAGHWFAQGKLTILTEHAEKGLEIFQDVLTHPIFKNEDVEREKNRIISGIREDKSDPNSVLDKEFRRTLYGSHPLGRPVEGYEKTVSKLTRDDVLDFYRSYYSPSNATLIVVSSLDINDAKELIKKYFEQWKRREVVLPSIGHPKPIKGKRVVVIDMDVSQAFVAMGHFGIKRNNPDFNKLQVANYILGGGGFASRFFKTIRNEKGYAYSVYSYFAPGIEFPGFFRASLETKLENTSKAINLMLDLIKEFKEKGAKDEELKDAKSYFEGSIPRRSETYGQVASALLNEEIYDLPRFHWLKDIGEIKKVTRDDVLQVARKYFDTENMVIVIVGKKDSLHLNIEGVGEDQIKFKMLE